ncbi:MAG: BLUF domain-containing protein [Gammaproteobacteria bacterium]|nr:BLUF domain-containing protein [Gammaproteobacteria bacterium]
MGYCKIINDKLGCSYILYAEAITIKRIIYTSDASPSFNEKYLPQLVESCQKQNTELGVSGILLYGTGKFLQVLEGDETEIDNIFIRILKDERHQNIIVIEENTIKKKDFENWSMGFSLFNSNELNESLSSIETAELSEKALSTFRVSDSAISNNIKDILYGFRDSLLSQNYH